MLDLPFITGIHHDINQIVVHAMSSFFFFPLVIVIKTTHWTRNQHSESMSSCHNSCYHSLQESIMSSIKLLFMSCLHSCSLKRHWIQHNHITQTNKTQCHLDSMSLSSFMFMSSFMLPLITEIHHVINHIVFHVILNIFHIIFRVFYVIIIVHVIDICHFICHVNHPCKSSSLLIISTHLFE